MADAIEKHGSEVTETSVRVGGVDISLREGRGSIRGLRIANPVEFGGCDAFTLGDITIDIDLESLRQEPIVIEEIRIAAPVVNVVISGTGSSNIDELRKTIQSHTPASSGSGETGDTKRIRIQRFIFEQGIVAVDASALGLDQRTIDLTEIGLDDIGGAEGALPDEITRTALMAIIKRVSSELASSEIKGLLEEKLGGSVEDAAKDLLDKFGK